MSVFDPLSPQAVVRSVEAFSGLRLDGSLVPYNSYINRVYGLRDEDGRGWVAKFYRPGRWDEETLAEEHAFLADCAEADLPVARPRADGDGQTLGELWLPDGDGGERPYFFAVFEKKGGRNFDAEGPEDWRRLGSLLGRLHAVGRRGVFRHRPVFTPESTLSRQIDELLNSGAVHPDLDDEFDDLLWPAAEDLAGRFAEPLQRIHGDVHRGNILDRPGEGLLLMDFDDCAWGPPVQDLWLLLPDHAENCRREIGLLTEGYAAFSPEDDLDWGAVEALRLMRMVHFLAWCGRQRGDRGFESAFPGWGSKGFWIKELEDLRDQVDRLSGRGD